MNFNNLNDILECRYCLETQLAFLCASRITDDEIEELRKILSLQCCYTDYRKVIYDTQFHKFIAKCSRNNLLFNFYMDIFDTIQDYIIKSIQSNTPDAFNDDIIHISLFEAISDRKPSLAYEFAGKLSNNILIE